MCSKMLTPDVFPVYKAAVYPIHMSLYNANAVYHAFELIEIYLIDGYLTI